MALNIQRDRTGTRQETVRRRDFKANAIASKSLGTNGHDGGTTGLAPAGRLPVATPKESASYATSGGSAHDGAIGGG